MGSLTLLGAGGPPVAASGSLTFINSSKVLTGGSNNPTVTFSTSNGATIGDWLLVFVVSLASPGTFQMQNGAGNTFTALATPQTGGGSYYNAVYAIRLVSGDIGTPQFTTTIAAGDSYIWTEIVRASGTATAASYTNWLNLDTTGTANLPNPAHAPITGSVGYVFMGLMYLNVSTTLTSSNGVIRNDVLGGVNDFGPAEGHSAWGSYISPGANATHNIAGYSATAFEGGLIELGT